MSASQTIRELAEDLQGLTVCSFGGSAARPCGCRICEIRRRAVAIVQALDDAKLDILASTDAHGNPSLANAHLSIPDPGRKPRAPS